MSISTRNAIFGMLTLTILFFALIGIGVEISGNADTKELKLVHVIMRHGIRTPVDTYPKDPHINETLYPTGWGQLTNQGKLDLYNVGKYLRQRYGKFLGTRYNPNEYYTQSTDVDRTKASMQLVNAGLWPPDSDQQWGPLDWQPIPIHSEPLNDDSLLLVRKPCAQYHLELDKVKKSPEIQNKLKKNEKLFKELTDLTGKEVKDFDDVQDIFSTLRAEEAANLTLPDWTKEYYPKKMYDPTVFSFILNTYNDKLNRLKGGLLLKKIIDDWTSYVNGSIKPEEQKAFLYGGHDSTIVNIMRSLDVWDPQLPDYAITVLLEFSKDTISDVYGVEVFLRNSTSAEPFLVTIPGCEKFCPLDKLEELRSNVIPDNWEEECKTDDSSYTPPPPKGP